MAYVYALQPDVVTFGRGLILSQDLDPLYVMLRGGLQDLPLDQMERWCVAYWCWYHSGVASYMSEFRGEEFWDHMFHCAIGEYPCPTGGYLWPRGRERRHFRAANATNLLQDLINRYEEPEEMVARLRERRHFAAMSQCVREHTGFGPWIAWKVADMMERVLGCPVCFAGTSLAMYAEPVKGAELLGRGTTDEATAWLITQVEDLEAPPSLDRPCGVQEVETILCKWKAHLNGFYPPMHDTRELRHGLDLWAPLCATAATLTNHLPCL